LSRVKALEEMQKQNDKIKEQNLNKDLLSNEEFFNNSDYIVEGKLIKKWNNDEWYVRSYDAKGLSNVEDLYSEYIFKVNFVYKDVDKLIKINDTLIIVADYGCINKLIDENHWEYICKNVNELHSNGGIDLNQTNDFILFLNKSGLPDNPNKNNTYFRTEFLQNKKYARINMNKDHTVDQGTGKYITNYRIEGLDGLSFENRYELYKYMEHFEGVNVPLSDTKIMQRDLFGYPDAWNLYLIERKNTSAKEQNDSIKNYMLKLHEELMQNAKKKH
jgi:hypothetical protein